MKNLARLLLLSAVVSVLPAEEWVLTFNVETLQTREDPKGEKAPTTETRRFTQTVALGTSYLAVQDDRKKFLYDFRGRRMVMADLAAGTHLDLSLYHLPSFFEHEIINHAALRHAMRAADSTRAAALFDRFESETALRVLMPARLPTDQPAPVIETVAEGDALEFRHAGKTAVRFVPSPSALPATWHPRFVNYLAYSWAIHPEIRQALAKSRAIPQELVVTWRQLNTVTTATLRLVSSAADAGDSSVLPAGSRPPAPPANDPLYPALAKLHAVLTSAERPSRDEMITFVNKAVKAKRQLDAALALVEWGLQTGEQLTDEMRTHGEAFKRDAACQAYFSGLRPADKAGAEKQLATNAAIDRRGLLRAHMLDLQRANLLEQAGKPREALDAFLKVVQANPYHTGAWHDLGAFYLRNYEHDKAWQCWDPARQLYPGHPMMRDIIRLELNLVQSQPDFF